MDDPLDFYDTIITAGTSLRSGQSGTMGELESKPHPWLYSETARVGLGITASLKNRVIGIEDSSAGIVAIRLAGHAAIGIRGGNIIKGGVSSLCLNIFDNLEESMKLILGHKGNAIITAM